MLDKPVTRVRATPLNAATALADTTSHLLLLWRYVVDVAAVELSPLIGSVERHDYRREVGWVPSERVRA